MKEKTVPFYDRYWQQNPVENPIREETIARLIKNLSTKLSIHTTIGEWKQADPRYQNLLNICAKLHRPLEAAHIKIYYGGLLEDLGELDNALSLATEALHYFEKTNHPLGRQRSLYLIASIHHIRGNHDAALANYRQQLELREHIADKRGELSALNGMGRLYHSLGKHDEAMSMFEQSLQITKMRNRAVEMANVSGYIGLLHKDMGDFDQAMRCFKKQLKLNQQIGNKRGICLALGSMAMIFSLQGDWEQALDYNRQFLEMTREMGDVVNVSVALANMSQALIKIGQHETVLKYLDEAIAIGRKLNIPYYLCAYLHSKADFLFTLDQFDEADPLNQEALRMATAVADPEIEFLSQVLDARIRFRAANQEEAIHKLKTMLDATDDLAETAKLVDTLFTFTGQDAYRQRALALYRELNTQTPRIEYEDRISVLANQP